MVNILSFEEVTDIVVFHINMDASKEKVIKFHMQDRRIIHFRACAEGMFYTNLDDPSMVTYPINTSVNPNFILYTMKKTLIFTDSGV